MQSCTTSQLETAASGRADPRRDHRELLRPGMTPTRPWARPFVARTPWGTDSHTGLVDVERPRSDPCLRGQHTACLRWMDVSGEPVLCGCECHVPTLPKYVSPLRSHLHPLRGMPSRLRRKLEAAVSAIVLWWAAWLAAIGIIHPSPVVVAIGMGITGAILTAVVWPIRREIDRWRHEQ